MEILVRIAMKKFYVPEVNTVYESIKKLFKEHVIPYMEQVDSHRFCQWELWNEECDYILRDYTPALETIYSMYSGKLSLPGSPKFVSLDEFLMMLINGRVISDNFTMKDAAITYNEAMTTQINELDFNRHM